MLKNSEERTIKTTVVKLSVLMLVALLAVLVMPLLMQSADPAAAEAELCVYAAGSNGADAHSKSMSVGSGDAEVNAGENSDESNTETEPSEYDDSQVTDEAGFDTDDVARTGDEAARELDIEDEVGVVDISGEGKTKLSRVKIAVIVVVVLMAIGAAILLFRSRRRDKYESKH